MGGYIIAPTLPNSISFSNADRTILASECAGNCLIVRQTGTLSAARTLTLPAANAVQAGYEIKVIDESGSPSWWYPINVTRGGSDTVNGLSAPVQIDLPYESASFISNGSNGWTSIVYGSSRQDLLLTVDDFESNHLRNFGGTAGFVLSSSSPASAASRLGAYRLVSINTVGGIGVYVGQNNNNANSLNSVVLGQGICRVEWRVNILQLPNGTDDYIGLFGLHDRTNNVVQSDSVTLRLNRAISTTNWVRTTIQASAITNTDTGVAASTGWVNLAFEVNAAASAIDFFVNGVSAGQATSNIPVGAGRETSPGIGFSRVANTASFDWCEVDRFRMLYLPTTPR